MPFATQSLLESGMTRDMFGPMTLASVMPTKVCVFLALWVPYCPHGNMPRVAGKHPRAAFQGNMKDTYREIRGREAGYLT